MRWLLDGWSWSGPSIRFGGLGSLLMIRLGSLEHQKVIPADRGAQIMLIRDLTNTGVEEMWWVNMGLTQLSSLVETFCCWSCIAPGPVYIEQDGTQLWGCAAFKALVYPPSPSSYLLFVEDPSVLPADHQWGMVKQQLQQREWRIPLQTKQFLQPDCCENAAGWRAWPSAVRSLCSEPGAIVL